MAISLALGVDADFFPSAIAKYDQCTNRFLHYPPCDAPTPADGAPTATSIRIGEHTDYGIYTYANGDRYGGSWRQGKKHGVGTYYFGSGAKYQGEYRDGNPHGRATFIEADGRAFAEEEQPVECALHPGLRT